MRENVGIIFQQPSMDPQLSAEENSLRKAGKNGKLELEHKQQVAFAADLYMM